MRALRKVACDLPLEHVGPLLEFPGAPGSQALDVTFRGTTIRGYDFDPRAAIGFTVWPGPGCETAEFALAVLPKTVRVPGGKRVATRPAGWRSHEFCKTQYASAPQLGGIDNFLRCHLSLIRLLDCARSLGISARVDDEGNYWTLRDRSALIRELEEYNQLIAGFGGVLKDSFGSGVTGGSSVTGPIFQYSNFEHLEADASR